MLCIGEEIRCLIIFLIIHQIARTIKDGFHNGHILEKKRFWAKFNLLKLPGDIMGAQSEFGCLRAHGFAEFDGIHINIRRQGHPVFQGESLEPVYLFHGRFEFLSVQDENVFSTFGESAFQHAVFTCEGNVGKEFGIPVHFHAAPARPFGRDGKLPDVCREVSP